MADRVPIPTHRANLQAGKAKGSQWPVAFDAGPTVPADGTTGYAAGAFHIETDAASGARWSKNYGTLTSSNFDKIQPVRDVSGNAGGQMFGGGDNVPADGTGTAGWAQNGIFVDTNAARHLGIYQNFGNASVTNFDNIQGIRDTAGGADGQIIGTGTVLPTGQGTGFGSGSMFVLSTSGKTFSWGLYINRGGATTANFVGILAAGDAQMDDGFTQAGFATGALHLDTDRAAGNGATAWSSNVGGPLTADFNKVTLTVA